MTRAKINAGLMDYLDVHLSHVAQMVWQGFFGHLHIAVVELSGVTEGGELIPSSSVGNNKTWIDQADSVILEVNSWQPSGLDGMHDIYYGTALPPNRKPIQITHTGDRIGVPYLRCPPEKIVAAVETHSPDRNSPFKPVDDDWGRIADNVVEFLAHEVQRAACPRSCSRCSPESAISQMRFSRAWTRDRFGHSRPTPRSSRTACCSCCDRAQSRWPLRRRSR